MRKLYLKSRVVNMRKCNYHSDAELGENYVGGARSSFLRRLQVYGIPGDS